MTFGAGAFGQDAFGAIRVDFVAPVASVIPQAGLIVGIVAAYLLSARIASQPTLECRTQAFSLPPFHGVP